MKVKHLIPVLLVLTGLQIHALSQTNQLLPTLAQQPDTFNCLRPGMDIREAVAHMRSRISPTDTGEGGAAREVGLFEKFWTEPF